MSTMPWWLTFLVLLVETRQRAELITPVCPRITIGAQTAGSWKCQGSRPQRQWREDCSRSELFGEPSSTWDDLCELVSAWTCSCGWLLYDCQPLQVQGHRLSQPLLHLSPYRRRLGVAVVSSPLGSVTQAPSSVVWYCTSDEDRHPVSIWLHDVGLVQWTSFVWPGEDPRSWQHTPVQNEQD